MTLEEAIIHCKEKACDNTQCALEHRQLAEWLEELKEYRKNAIKEQPEVDLEKELDKYLRGEFQQTAGGNFNNYIQVARHFYELGRTKKEGQI